MTPAAADRVTDNSKPSTIYITDEQRVVLDKIAERLAIGGRKPSLNALVGEAINRFVKEEGIL